MTTQVLFVQGAGSGVHESWDRKLVESLRRELGPGFEVRYPRMPHEEDPRYRAWKPALIAELDALEGGAFLVGHSVGGTVLLNVLAEHRPRTTPAAVILVAAPFVGEGGWRPDDIPAGDDFDERLPDALPISLYHGTADETVPVAHVRLYARAIPRARVSELAGRDHQLGNDLAEVAREIRSRSGPPSVREDPSGAHKG